MNGIFTKPGWGGITCRLIGHALQATVGDRDFLFLLANPGHTVIVVTFNPKMEQGRLTRLRRKTSSVRGCAYTTVRHRGGSVSPITRPTDVRR